MSDTKKRKLSLKRALGLSTVLHLVLGPVLVASLAVSLAPDHDAETLATVTQRETVTPLAIERRLAASARAVVRAARTWSHEVRRRALAAAVRPGAAEAATAPPLHRLSVHAPRLDAVRASGETAAATSIFERAAPARDAPKHAEPVRVAEEMPVAQPPTETAAPVAAPVPASAAPSAAPVEQVAARGGDIPVGGWGQTFEKPIVGDDGGSALAALRSKYHGASPITVDVDESGHAVKVSSPSSLPSDARADIEKTLLALKYVPAECNGLRCAGTLSLAL